MIIAVDIGNTNIVCGLYDRDELLLTARVSSDKNRTADEYYCLFSSLFSQVLKNNQIDCVACSSVVPELSRIWQHMCNKFLGINPIMVNGYTPLGLSFNVNDPGFIGADLVVNAFSAWKKYQTNTIICDLGTATTIQLVSDKGRFIGTIIAPGIKTAAERLFEKAALLYGIELTEPKQILGTNTKDALLSGIVRGHALMIEGFIKEIKSRYIDYYPMVSIATGGIAELIMPLVPSLDKLDKTLTLDGLHLAAKTIKLE